MEIIDTELRVIEALLLQGAALAARARLDALHDAPQRATLLRLHGVAAIQLGESNAKRHLLASVDAARESGSAHELALSLHVLAWADPTNVHAREGAGQIFGQLGVVWVPDMPRTATAATSTLLVLPAQRAAPVRI